GGVRVDGSSSFGAGIATAVYPKVNASWVISEEPFWPRIPGLSGLRLRAALGESGVEPSSTARLAEEQLFTTFAYGTVASGARLAGLGNPNLHPERTREVDAGADIDVVHDRLHLEVTYYDKHSTDALVTVPLGPSIGAG